MSVNINIPISDHGASGVCTDYYFAEYKKTTDSGYTPAARQFESPVVLPNLDEDVAYDVRITRFCCNGERSNVLTLIINTTQLGAPANFTAVGGAEQVTLTWDSVTNADNYVIERDTDSNFTSPVEVYNGDGTSDLDPDYEYVDTGLLAATTYYYRIKATASDYGKSDYSTANATTS